MFNILIAEDDDDDFTLFCLALQRVLPEKTVVRVIDGDNFVNHINEMVLIPDIIFLDINMPCKNGNECLVELRSRTEFDAVPVVMLTTSGSDKDIEFSFLNGANLYVPKPLEFRKLIEKLAVIFQEDWKTNLLNPVKETFVL